jgi:hypothetical protein
MTPKAFINKLVKKTSHTQENNSFIQRYKRVPHKPCTLKTDIYITRKMLLKVAQKRIFYLLKR